MKTLLHIISASIAIAATAFWPGVSQAQSTTETLVTPASVAADFKAVTGKLDFGGTAFSYSSYHGVIDNIYAVLEPLLQIHPQARGFGLMGKSALLKLGLNDLSIGSSVLPKEDGSEVRKTYVRSVGRPGILALWGSSGEPLKSLAHIPKNATAAWCGKAEFAQILPIINSMAEGAIGPNGPAMVDGLMDKANEALSVNIEETLAGLGNEYELHFIQKKDTSGKSVPVFTFRLAVKNDTPYEAAKKLAGETVKVEAVADEDDMVKLLYGSGDDGRLYYLANQPEWLVVSTSIDEIKRTTEIPAGERLLDSPDFQKTAPGMPAHIDALTYVSQAYSDSNLENMLGNLDKAKASIPDDEEEGDSSAEVMRAAMDSLPKVVENMGLLAPYTGWRVNDPDGILFTEIGKPRHGPTAIMAVTGGIVISIAVPAFLRARENARARACQENLMKLDGAKEQYALEHKKANGDPVTMEDLKPYLNETPKCPADGEYALNPIGTDPTCSVGKDVLEGAVPHSLEDDE